MTVVDLCFSRPFSAPARPFSALGIALNGDCIPECEGLSRGARNVRAVVGVARLTGAVTCTGDDPDAFLFSVEGELSQKVGRFTIRGYFFTELFVPCDGQTRTWEGLVAGENGTFAGGRAAAVTYTFGCGAVECGFGYNESIVKLRRNGK